MCLVFEIIMILMGLWGLIKGRLPITKNRVLEGRRARITGIVLILPVPLALGISLAMSYYLTRSSGIPISVDEQGLEFLLVIGAIIFAVIQKPAKPNSAERLEKTQVAGDLPDQQVEGASKATELISKGNQLKGEGKYAEAENCYKQVLTDEPRNEAAWFSLGDNFVLAHSYGKALACFEQVVALNQEYPMAKAKIIDLRPIVNSNPSHLRLYQHEKKMFASISRFNFDNIQTTGEDRDS